MRSSLLIGGLICLLPINDLPASPRASTHAEEFLSVATWVLQTGSLHDLEGCIPKSLGVSGSKMRVISRTFDEPGADIRHMFCVSAAREFFFLISTDIGDGSSTLWRVSPYGALISTVCFAGGAMRTVPSEEFETEFLVEKEYFLRTMHFLQPHPNLTLAPEKQASKRSKVLALGSVFFQRHE